MNLRPTNARQQDPTKKYKERKEEGEGRERGANNLFLSVGIIIFKIDAYNYCSHLVRMENKPVGEVDTLDGRAMRLKNNRSLISYAHILTTLGAWLFWTPAMK